MRAFILKKIEKLLNNTLALDPESKKQLDKLNGKVITIELHVLTDLIFQLHFNPSGIELISSDFCDADTMIKGTPISLLHLSLSPSNRKKFFSDNVAIEGNAEVAQQVMRLFDELDIDWEEYASQWLGDAPAHSIGNFAKKIAGFSRNCKETLFKNINEYTHEEIQLFPPKEALQDFYHDVDTLRMDVDRLEARFNKIMQTIKEV